MDSKTLLVVAPNGGQSLDYGGGAFTTIVMANTLAGAGYRVYLLALNSPGRAELEKVHGVSIDDSVTTIFLNEVYGRPIRFIPHLGIRMLSEFIQNLALVKNVVCVIFGDDAPRGLPFWLRRNGIRSLLYCHFSYFLRSLNPRIASFSYNDRAGLISSMLYWRFNFDPLENFEEVICNSTVTQKFVKQYFPAVETTVIHPPSLASAYAGPKELWLLHAAQLGRPVRYDLMGEAAGELQRRVVNAKLIVTRSRVLPHPVRKRLQASPNVLLLNDLAREEYLRLLAKSSFYLSFRWFEPFGISTVEAMARGTIPILYKSSLSGSWTDVIERGMYGGSFTSASELVQEIESLVANRAQMAAMSQECTRRANLFSVERFEKKLIDFMGSRLSES